MKITIVARQLGVGGAERQLHLLATTIASSQFAVDVLSLGDSPDEYWALRLRSDGIPVTHVAGDGLLARLLAVRRRLRESAPGVVHAWHFSAGVYGVLARLDARVPMVVGLRALPDASAIRPSLADRVTLSAARTIVCNSRAANEMLRARFPRAAPSIVIPNGVEIGARPAQPGDHVAPPSIGLVARLVPGKRIDRFLRCVAGVRDEHPTLRATVVGDGPERAALVALSRRLGLSGVVEFLGEVPAQPILERFDVLCLTSDSESAPNVLLEAAAAGIPVVATRVGGAADIVHDGETGFLVCAEDEATFRQRVSALLADPIRRREMGAAARRRIERSHGVDSMADAYRSLYTQLMPRRHSGV